MTKSFFLILAITGIQYNVLAQSKEDFFLNADSFKTKITADFDYFVNSNAVTNSFVNALLFPSFIDDALKDKVSNKLKAINRLGYDIKTGISFSHHSDNFLRLGKLKYTIGLYDRRHFDTKFSDDLFELFLRGNAPFAGDSADINGLDVNQYTYQQIYFGLEKKSNKVKIGGGISLLKGLRYRSVKINRGMLFTQKDGEYVDLDINIGMQISDTSNLDYWAFKGIGTSLDLYGSYEIKENNTINLEIRDIGFISWNNRSTTYQVDSFFHFQGMVIANILNVQDSIFSNVAPDSLLNNLNLNNSNESIISVLPLRLHLNYVRQINTKLKIIAGVHYYLFANYIPRIYARGVYALSPSFAFAPLVAYGGYGNLDIGLTVFARLPKGFLLTAGSDNLEGFIMPSSTTGQGAYLTLSKLF